MKISNKTFQENNVTQNNENSPGGTSLTNLQHIFSR